MFKVSLNIVRMIKTITIKDEVFNLLSSQKGKDESFSDLFERLLLILLMIPCTQRAKRVGGILQIINKKKKLSKFLHYKGGVIRTNFNSSI